MIFFLFKWKKPRPKIIYPSLKNQLIKFEEGTHNFIKFNVIFWGGKWINAKNKEINNVGLNIRNIGRSVKEKVLQTHKSW